MTINDNRYPAFTDSAVAVLNRRYLKRDPATGQPAETPDDMFRRVAQDLAQADISYGADAEQVAHTAETFYGIMRRLEFLPNSPTLMNAGRPLQQLSACFVLPVEDSLDSIFDTVKETALIHKSGGGTGFAFSRLRPQGDTVKSTAGVASGPTSFIRAFDTGTDVVKQGGTRRGANMAVLSCYHPDVLEFVNAKLDPQNLQNFNISVGVDAAFMANAAAGHDYELINPRTGTPAGTANAAAVFDAIVHNAWLTGDPGILFLDRINNDNPNPGLGQIEATNPCGEQPLLPYESCNLGSINLLRMLTEDSQPKLDHEKLADTARVAVHMLDNVIDRNSYPLDAIRDMTLDTRRIGVGVMGWADALIRMGIPYDSDQALQVGETVMAQVQQAVHQASRDLAATRGTFPAWNKSIYATDGKPMRNSAPTTIAPTGTISIIAGVSSGIEPLFALAYTRNVMDNTRLPEVNDAFRLEAEYNGFYSDELMRRIAEVGHLREDDAVPDHVRRVFRTSHQIGPYHHVAMQAVFQKHTDNAVSKTINFAEAATVDDIATAYRMAWDSGCKGITVYRDGSKDSQVLTAGATTPAVPAAESHAIPAVKRARPQEVSGTTYRIRTGHGNAYITVNTDENGKPLEVFANIGKAGACDDVVMHSLTRIVSLALRSNVPVEEIIDQIRGNTCCPIWENGQLVKSSSDAIGIALESALGITPAKHTPEITQQADFPNIRNRQRCPSCQGWAFLQSGCLVCISCGWSQC